MDKVTSNTSRFSTQAVFAKWKPSKELLLRISDIRISNMPSSVGMLCVEINYTRDDLGIRQTSVIFMD